MDRIRASNLSEDNEKRVRALVSGGKIVLSSFNGVSDEDLVQMLHDSIELHAGFFQPVGSSGMTEQDQFQVAKKLKTLLQSEESIVSRFTDLEYCVYIEEEQALTIVNKPDVPLSPPVLSLEAKQMIVNENCQNEHQLIVCFTPTLEELSNECGFC